MEKMKKLNNDDELKSNTTSVERAVALIKRSPTEEILTEERLVEYLNKGVKLNHYIGFEISGMVHLGTGLVSMQKVADLQEAGANTNLFLADYHSAINNKLGGDIDNIRRIALGYFKEGLQQSLKCVGGDPERTKVVLASDFYKADGLKYLEDVINVAKGMSLGRAKRSVTILGRKSGDDISLAQLLYVPMQVADIYGQNLNLPHAGMDQRKAHVVALDASKNFTYSPVALHHHLLMGINITNEQRNQVIEARVHKDRETLENSIIDIKMSKSKPASAIFVHDSEEEISAKIDKALCPAREVEVNPVIDITRYIIAPTFERANREIEISNAKSGQTKTFSNIKELEEAYIKGEIHPLDLKNMVKDSLISILEPARKHFASGPGLRHLNELKELMITR